MIYSGVPYYITFHVRIKMLEIRPHVIAIETIVNIIEMKNTIRYP
jgi:hypothetical protein